MRKRGRFVLVMLVSVLLLFGITAAVVRAQQAGSTDQTGPTSPTGQTSSDAEKGQALQELQYTRLAIQMERQTIVTQAMDLTPEEMEGFWPLYREYRVEMVKVGDRMVKLITDYADNYESLTDPVADKLLTNFVSIEKQRAALKAKYLPKFKKVLPARKVARFYQIENKLDIAILSEVADAVPLAR